jgi:hypothetical protein
MSLQIQMTPTGVRDVRPGPSLTPEQIAQRQRKVNEAGEPPQRQLARGPARGSIKRPAHLL